MKHWNEAVNIIKILEDSIEHVNKKDRDEILSPEILKLLEGLNLKILGDNVLLKYNEAANNPAFWEESEYSELYKYCRGTVVNYKTGQLLIAPFKKFFNIGENNFSTLEDVIALLDNNYLEITDKADGANQNYTNDKELGIIYSGTGTFSVGGKCPILDKGRTFINDNYKRLIISNSDYTFIFELVSDLSEHTVKYDYEKDSGLYLLGAVNKITGKEISLHECNELFNLEGIRQTEVEYYIDKDEPLENKIKILEEIIGSKSKYKASEKEGYVVNIGGTKFKCKMDNYFEVHSVLRKLLSRNTILQHYAEGKLDDLYANVPEDQKHRIKRVADKLDKYKKDKNSEINRITREICIVSDGSTKEFMKLADKLPKNIRGYVKNSYLGKDFDVLYNKFSGKLTDWSEIEEYISKDKDKSENTELNW